MSRLPVAFVALSLAAADFADVNPNVFGPDDPRTKDLPKMMSADARRRMQEANQRESKAFAAVATKEQWEAYRDARVRKLRESLGARPDPPKDMPVRVTKEIAGDGFVVRNVVYESRPGLWVSANLYLPAKPPAKMPGVLISHSHHTPKTHGELQDMGMTWARSGVAVLVPDHLGHGERRQHDFRTEKDYDQPFRVGRQDYYFRYNSNLQLSAAGESLMGWMVWDLMRGVDVLLKQPTIDKDRLILLGAVAGGGDPAGVTAALDPRVACVVPFNFGGWQPESRVLDDPDRDFAWFGDGYWESTRGLRNGARDGFAHFVIVGSVAPRKVIYAHEFAWDPKTDPAWPRLQKVFDFYGAKDALRVAHGAGKVTGPGGPENTHCTHIGAVHRKMIYPALKEWFGMPIPDEYSKRLPADELLCWTDAAAKELKPKRLHEVAKEAAADNRRAALSRLTADDDRWRTWVGKVLVPQLGRCEPAEKPAGTEGKSEAVPGGTLTRLVLEPDPGIVVPLLLLTPAGAKGKVPVVVMVAQGGKAGFLKERGEVIAAFLRAGVAVCLADVRGTGETRAGDGAGRGSARTSVSQTNLILGQPVLGSQLRDLRTVVRWLQGRDGIDGARLAVWGDSFAKPNPRDGRVAVPLDAELPAVAEPGGPRLAILAALCDRGVPVVVARGWPGGSSLTDSPYLYVPHDAVLPSPAFDAVTPVAFTPRVEPLYSWAVDSLNREIAGSFAPAGDATSVIEKLTGKK